MKTTKKQFELFKDECAKWAALFGLNDWEMRYVHEKDEKHIAWTAFNYHGRQVTVGLTKTWASPGVPCNDYEIKCAAFHEVCEILLYPIVFIGESRYINDGEMEPMVHEVIHKLDLLLSKP